MNDTPLVSIIVPIYNASEWLTGSFRSFERQTYDDIEWILVDDGSVDESADLCASWCRKDAARRRFIHKENGGASSARNLGLSYATGDYVMFWDADDEQDLSACQTMVESVMQRYDSAVAVCAIRRVLPDGSQVDLFTCDQHALTSEQALDEWFGGGVSTGPYTKLVPRSLLVDNDIRFKEGITNEDVMWTAEVLSSANSVMLLGEPLYRYIARAGSVTNTFQAGTVVVFDNCRKLESFIARHHPGLLDSCTTYCARSCWNVILAASRGDNKSGFQKRMTWLCGSFMQGGGISRDAARDLKSSCSDCWLNSVCTAG